MRVSSYTSISEEKKYLYRANFILLGYRKGIHSMGEKKNTLKRQEQISRGGRKHEIA